MKTPDYSKYSKEELQEALASVDRKMYPERIKNIIEELSKLEGEEINEPEQKKKEFSKESIIKGRIIFPIVGLILLYFTWLNFKSGVYHNRITEVSMEEDPILFAIKIGIGFIFGFVCIAAGAYYWLRQK